MVSVVVAVVAAAIILPKYGGAAPVELITLLSVVAGDTAPGAIEMPFH